METPKDVRTVPLCVRCGQPEEGHPTPDPLVSQPEVHFHRFTPSMASSSEEEPRPVRERLPFAPEDGEAD